MSIAPKCGSVEKYSDVGISIVGSRSSVPRGAVCGEAQHVEQIAAEQVLILHREVAGVRGRVLEEVRVGLRQDRLRVVPRPAHHERVLPAEVVVELDDAEVLVGRILVRVHELRRAVAEIDAVRNREQQVQIRPRGRMDADIHERAVGIGHDALVRERVGQPRMLRHGVALAELLVGAEVEQLGRDDRPADGAAELVALEGRQIAGREIVPRVQARRPCGTRRADPRSWFVPDLVTVLMTPPAARPNSAL